MGGHPKNKVAIVTGSSSGLGEAIAILFASRGAKVTLHGRDQGRLRLVFDKVVKVSGGHTDRFMTVSGDINDQSVRKQIVDQTVEKFGGLDILVAYAGVSHPDQSVMIATEEKYDDIMDTNVKSVFFLSQQAASHLEMSKGNIIIMSSCITSMLAHNFGIYALSKVALDYLTRFLAVELGPKGVRVNSVNPGFVNTRIAREYKEETVDAILEIERKIIHLAGPLLTADDGAEAVAFLTSPEAHFITGENMAVDGGRRFGSPLGGEKLRK